MQETQVQKVTRLVIRAGLKIPHDGLPKSEVHKQEHAVKILLQDYTAEQILAAAQNGMPQLWPFTDGRSWDVWDLKKNMPKALGEAGRARRTGAVFFPAQQIPAYAGGNP